MKKTLSILAWSVLPTLALAAGNHGGGHGAPAHGMPGHDMSTMSNAPSPTGQPGDPAKVTRTIELTMDDTMRFTPGDIQVRAGETVRFFIKNTGKIPQHGHASCRESVCPSVWISLVAVSLKKKTQQ